MEDIYLVVGAAVLLLIQIVCLFAKKVWVRLLPVLIVGALMVLCVVMYAVSGWTNWAYLILLLLLFVLLAAMGVAWLIFGILRAVRKMIKNSKV